MIRRGRRKRVKRILTYKRVSYVCISFRATFFSSRACSSPSGALVLFRVCLPTWVTLGSTWVASMTQGLSPSLQGSRGFGSLGSHETLLPRQSPQLLNVGHLTVQYLPYSLYVLFFWGAHVTRTLCFRVIAGIEAGSQASPDAPPMGPKNRTRGTFRRSRAPCTVSQVRMAEPE